MITLAATALFSARTGADGIERAVGEAERLLLAADSHAAMLAELGAIELPPVARAEPMQLRAVASLYLASTLEGAGLIEATDDLTRLVRGGAVARDLGAAAPLVAAFWNGRNARATSEERAALFGRLFGAPGRAVDLRGSANEDFEERLLDLCDAIIDTTGQGSLRRVRATAVRLAENLAGATNDTVLLMARDIIGSLSQAIAILNHPGVRGALMARTLWDVVAAIDRRFRRPARPTLSYLRRGRAGMTVLAWLADVLDGGREDAALTRPNHEVIEAAVTWVDETLAILRAEGAAAESGVGNAAAPGQSAWLDIER